MAKLYTLTMRYFADGGRAERTWPEPLSVGDIARESRDAAVGLEAAVVFASSADEWPASADEAVFLLRRGDDLLVPASSGGDWFALDVHVASKLTPYFWWRDGEGSDWEVVRVHNETVAFFHRYGEYVDFVGGEWGGPISPDGSVSESADLQVLGVGRVKGPDVVPLRIE